MVIKKTLPILPISRSTWAEIGLLALASVFGMQALRALPRVIFFTFRSMPGVSHFDMVLLAFGVFLISFLSALLRHLLKAPAALTLTAGGMVVTHLVRLLSLSPGVELVSVTVGVGLYLLFLPIYLGCLRGRGVDGMARYGIGLLLGLTLDSGLRGVWEFWLLSEQFTGLLLLSLMMALLLLSCRPSQRVVRLPSVVARSSRQSHSDGDFLPTLPVLALGPFLLTQVLLYQNVAYLTVLSQWPRSAVLGWVVLMNLLGMGAFVFVVKHIERSFWMVVAFGTITTLMPLLARLGGLVTMVGITVGYVILAGMLGLITVTLALHATCSGLWRTAIANGIGMFLFIFLLFILSLVVLPTPYNDWVTLPTQVATIIVGLCALTATRQPSCARNKNPLKVEGLLAPWSLFQKSLLLLLLLAPATLLWQPPEHPSGLPGTCDDL